MDTEALTATHSLGLQSADRIFLSIVHNQEIRQDLLALLQDLELLSSFLLAENGTTPTI